MQAGVRLRGMVLAWQLRGCSHSTAENRKYSHMWVSEMLRALVSSHALKVTVSVPEVSHEVLATGHGALIWVPGQGPAPFALQAALINLLLRVERCVGVGMGSRAGSSVGCLFFSHFVSFEIGSHSAAQAGSSPQRSKC